MKIIFCGFLFDSVSYEHEKNKAIFIDKNIIVKIDKIDNVKLAKGYEIIDLKDKFVMPGLIDAHVHINMNGELDSDRLFLYQTVAEMTLNSVKNVQRDMMAGFTTLRDVGSVAYSDVAVRNAIKAGKFWGPRMLVCGWSISPPGGSSDSKCVQGITGNHPHGYIVNGVNDVLKISRENFKYGADAIKIMVTNSQGAMGMAFEEMETAVKMAKAHNAISCAHASGAKSIINLVRAGITSIEHGTIVNEEGAQMMKDNDVYLVPTLIATFTSMERAELKGATRDVLISLQEKQKRLIECFNLYREKGVKICFGSDAAIPYIEHGKQTYEFELMTKMGLTPAEALKTATKTNAELLQWEDKVGTIEVGKYADIVAFKENPLDNIKAMGMCDFVMKDGIVHKKNSICVV